MPDSLGPELPKPPAEALVQSEKLVGLLSKEIVAAGGVIPFHGYMDRVLYTPGLGYYSGGLRKFGVEGDFVTAPELTPLFGRALAAEVAEIMRLSVPEVLEVGAGSGALAVDVLLELERAGSLPERYSILEVSDELRHRQRETIATRAPHLAERLVWPDTMPESYSGVVLGNEVLDAMPVHLVVTREGQIFERGVRLRESGFAFSDRPAQGKLLEACRALSLPMIDEREYQTEINLAARAWVEEWGKRLRQGALILIDYGTTQGAYYQPSRDRGTLLCHYRHLAHEDPFLWPGLSDITAWVDFTAIADAGFAAGLDVLGYTTQRQFLFNCGILELLAGEGPGESVEYLKAARAVRTLCMPDEMGDQFHVLALGKGIQAGLRGFSSGNSMHLL